MKWSKNQKCTKGNFSGLDLSQWAAGVIAPSLLCRETAPAVVHPALCGSHSNKTLQRSATQESWEAVLSDPAATQALCMKKSGEKSNPRTHLHSHTHGGTHPNTSTQIPKIHQRYSPCCITVTPPCVWFQSSLPPLCVLLGLNWYSQGATGWGWSKLAGGSRGFKGCN